MGQTFRPPHNGASSNLAQLQQLSWTIDGCVGDEQTIRAETGQIRASVAGPPLIGRASLNRFRKKPPLPHYSGGRDVPATAILAGRRGTVVAGVTRIQMGFR